MSMSRFPRATLLAVTGLLWALFCGQASGAVLPRLEGPAGYAGKLGLERENYRAELYLGPAGNFVLHEELLLPGGKVSGWEHTGFWRQVRGGAFVQLSNAAGLYRLLNVGGGGNLYLGMQFTNGEQRTAVLRRKAAAPVEFTFSGLLRPSDKETLLEDSDSGLTYRAVPGEALTAFLSGSQLAERSALPVQARAVEVPGSGLLPALQVRDIRSIPPEKKRASRDLAGVFLENVAGRVWQVTRLGDNAPAVVMRLRFEPGRDRREGRLEFFDGSRHLAGSYTLWNAELTLSASCEEPLNALLRRTRSWFLTGELLELRGGQEEPLALLEQLR